MFFAAAAWLALCLGCMCVGAIQFVVCVAVPRGRRYALSAALWWVVGGIVWMGLSVAGMFLASLIASPKSFWELYSGVRWGLVAATLVLSVGFATGVAWLHQVVVMRFTPPLFRFYSTAVTAGIGSVFGWALGVWLTTHPVRGGWFLWGGAMFVLVAGFGWSGFRYSEALQGERFKSVSV